MLGIPLGLALSNMGEWVIHKRMLHGLGKNKQSFWAFHWHEHHREARTHDMVDQQYVRSLFSWSPQGKEAVSLALGAVVMAPAFPVAPFFIGTLWYRMWRYYVIHKRSHLDSEWARQHLPWHVDHHLGKDQNANWCVTHPWFDHVMGTRKVYEYGARGAVREVPAASQGKSLLARAWEGLKEGWSARRPKRPSSPPTLRAVA